jgi:hypothetical protein
MNRGSRRALRQAQARHRSVPPEEQKLAPVAGAVMLVLLAASGLVLACSWFVPWPSPVFWGAVFIGALALGWILLGAYRSARTSGDSFVHALWRSLRAGLRFLVDFL